MQHVTHACMLHLSTMRATDNHFFSLLSTTDHNLVNKKRVREESDPRQLILWD